MGWNLPPGCTDKDIDDAAPQNEPEDEEEEVCECDLCHKKWPVDNVNEQYTLWGAIELICDNCIEGGDYPPEREAPERE